MTNRLAKLYRAWKKRALAVLAGLSVLALAVTNLDSIATTWSKYFGQSDELSALENAVNRKFDALPSKNQPVLLELVQTPKEQDPDEQIFDVYLKNNGSDDVLLTRVVYGDGFYYVSGNLSHNGSHTFAPDASYEISAKAKGEAALSPPYLLKGMSRGAVRFRFTNYKPSDLMATDTLAFEVYDSTGKKVATINAFSGE